jgi:hypothetical protein
VPYFQIGGLRLVWNGPMNLFVIIIGYSTILTCWRDIARQETISGIRCLLLFQWTQCLDALQFRIYSHLGFSVSISLLATGQSHCNFRSHMRPSFHNLTPFLPLFCSCRFRRLDSVQFQALIPAGRRPETRLFTSDYYSLLFFTAENL